MSHVTSSLAIITDLDVLRWVIKTFFPKLKWMEGQKTYKWYGNFQDDWGEENEEKTARSRGIDPSQYGKCDHALHLPGCPYEIGITKRNDGEGWSLVWDVWRGAQLSEYIGNDAEKLMLKYNMAYVEKYAGMEGCMIETTEEDDGIYMKLMS